MPVSEPLSGLDSLAYSAAVTVLLMVVLYLLSRVLMRFGLLPLSAALSLSGFNTLLFYVLILPGTVVHELSHYLACLLTGVRVRDVRLFSPQSDGAVGWVVHDQADPIRRNIIALAPFVGGSLAIYLLLRFGPLGREAGELLAIAPDVGQGFGRTLEAVVALLRSADLSGWGAWLLLYVIFSLGYAVAPSRQDLGHLLVDGLLAIALALLVALADYALRLDLAHSPAANALAAGVAGLLQYLNALLLFTCVVIGLGTLLIVPIAFVAYQLRAGLAQRG